MIELQKLKRKIDTLKDLKDVVSSMKAYANFTISKSKKELPYIREYQNSVEDSIAYMISYFPELKELKKYKGKNIYMLFGAQEGLCGGYNQKLIDFYKKFNDKEIFLIVIGRKIADEAEDKNIKIDYFFEGVSNIDSINTRVFKLVDFLGKLFSNEDINELNIIYSKLLPTSEIIIKKDQILPPDFEKFEKYVEVKEPLLYLKKDYILDSLIEEYILISLYRAFIEALSSENQARLITMQNAEKHIEKKTYEINEKLNILRQEEITNELMEIINGYKSIKRKKNG